MRLSLFVGALTQAVGDPVKSTTLGPKGMNKILQSGSTRDISVTNEGATILTSIKLDNAAAMILVDISKIQDVTRSEMRRRLFVFWPRSHQES